MYAANGGNVVASTVQLAPERANFGSSADAIPRHLQESSGAGAASVAPKIKTGVPGTDANGVGVAGGLNENAGIVSASVVVFACDLCRSRRASAGKLTGVVHASVEVGVP